MTRLSDGLGYPTEGTVLRSKLDRPTRPTRRTALRNLAAEDGADLDIVVVLGLTDDAGAELLRRALNPAATPADPAGCSWCERTAAEQRGCGWCWARMWREQQEVGAE